MPAIVGYINEGPFALPRRVRRSGGTHTIAEFQRSILHAAMGSLESGDEVAEKVMRVQSELFLMNDRLPTRPVGGENLRSQVYCLLTVRF